MAEIRNEKVEQNLTSITAKTEDVIELTNKASSIMAEANSLLFTVQKELERLYVSLEE